jgi:ElaA protein
MDLTWADLHHSALSARQLHDLLALRNKVFVVEQQCSYQDIDGRDLAGDNRHVLGTARGRLVCYARILAPDARNDAVRIGRIAVSKPARGQALGRKLVQRTLAAVDEHWPDALVELAAQAHLQAFYGELGFVPTSEVYDDDGIPHIDMRRA